MEQALIMILQSDLHRCLDSLEEEEVVLLAWGDSGGYFTREEVLRLIETACPQHDPDELFVALEKHAMLLLVEMPEGQIAYRTRMGESVHLYRNLRQWFHGKKLEQTRTLVSDFRFVRRQRSYPERKVIPEQLLGEWGVSLNLPASSVNIMRALLEPFDKFRLAGFQVRATERILKAWRHHSLHQNGTPTGTIICAGTGSGKTLAFYLPAMTALTEDLISDSTPRVRILAIYPRKELLKDQFKETWSQCRKLDVQIQKAIGRKIRIGSFFSDTPLSQKTALDDISKNTALQGLPYELLSCPTENCKGDMLWTRASLGSGREELFCSICSHRINQDEVGLTRESLTKLPPDILFTTTEMLNQHLGNHYQNNLFGVGSHKGPTLVLLDEVHTYGGNSGAQTAYLLRRWMQRSFCRPHFVGLSATLSDAENFFSELVGAQHHHIELVEPKTEEMIDEGAEYLLALRGDPVSQTALLSTTIQASMLTSRLLDNNKHISKGTWGEKTFVFTDDLDSINRLFHQLADAEGWKTSYKGLSPKDTPPLASLRGDPLTGQARLQRILLGQDWGSTKYIGHTLDSNNRARIGRTSSQDSGVDSQANIIVATASLEVGFNDPLVGAVIQHKAPRDVASYLQRKGRAGRFRTMRPWMLIVLSEFGRDRVAFQRYEDLLNPEIKRQSLPLKNGHIQKMQASMSVLDWLSMKLGHGSIWTILNNPRKYHADCVQLLKLIDVVMLPGRHQDSFIQFLQYSLKIEDIDLTSVLWAPPRSIMMEFIPSLRRLLATNWREYGEEWRALRPTRSPMPEFIPDALFSELNLPRLNIALQRGIYQKNKWESLSFYQALREFAPGRISKRYAIDSIYNADWLIPKDFKPTSGSHQNADFEIQEAFGDNLPDEGLVTLADGTSITIYRPEQIYSSTLDFNFHLSEKSNARLHWQVQFTTTQQAYIYSPPYGSWKNFLNDITFFSHRHMTPLEVIRFNTGSNATLNFKNGDPRTVVNFSWKHQNQPVGIGTRQWVDGLRFRFNINKENIQNILLDENVLSGLRPVYFRHLVGELSCFNEDPFTAGWVSECYLASLAAEFCLMGGRKPLIQNALKIVASEEGLARLRSIPESLFQPDDQDEPSKEQELQVKIVDLLKSPELLAEVAICADSLWKEPNQLLGFDDWAKSLLGNTLSASALQTLCTLFPDIDERAVIADYIWNEDELSIFVSESEPGGSGVISRLSDAYIEDPIRVLGIFTRNLQQGDYEQIDYDLYSMLHLLESDGPLSNAITAVRSASDHGQRKIAISSLHKALQVSGFALTHSFLSVLHSRVLRPGSSRETDSKLYTLLSKWRDIEKNSCIEWPLNIAAHTLASIDQSDILDPSILFRSFCKIQGLLWPRGYTIRQSELNYYNPFHGGVSITERLLGAKLFTDEATKVQYSEINWLTNLHGVLCKEGRANLIIERELVHKISDAITHCQIESVDHVGLLLYPRIVSIRRIFGSVVLRIELAESIQ
jgi:ATP-dependent Lhr-like helicase